MALSLSTRKSLQSGLALLDQGQTDPANELLAGLAMAHPSAGPARLFHGIACWDRGAILEAAAEFEAAHSLDPDNTLVHCYLALARTALGDREAARRLWALHGHHTNRGYRVRVTEWMEDGFLRHNGWPDHLPALPQQSAVEGDPDTPESELESMDMPIASERTPERAPWKPWLFGFGEGDARHLLEGEAVSLSWWQRGRLERRISRLFRRLRFEDVVDGVAPLLRDPKCDMVTIWVAATSAELTGRAQVGLELCERVTPREQWPDPLRALYGRCLYRVGRHQEAAKILAQVEVRGPEDFGVHWVLGGLALAQGDRDLARKLFHRAHTAYMVDTIENQWWAVEQALARVVSPHPPESGSGSGE